MLTPKQYAEQLVILVRTSGQYERRELENYTDHMLKLRQPPPPKV